MNENKEKLDLLSKKFKVIGKLTLASIALAIVFHFFVGEFMHWKTYDFMMKFVGGKESKPHKDVVLLLIDENSMRYGQALGLGRWPWKRNIYPEILQYINATNPPKGVFFDILFSESGVSSQNDSAFSQAIAASGNIFHNILITENIERRTPLKLPDDIKNNFAIKVKNIDNKNFSLNRGNEFTITIPCLRSMVTCDTRNDTIKNAQPSALGLSVALFAPDTDGVYRRGRIIFSYGENYLPSVTLSALLAYSPGSKIEIISGNSIKVGKYIIPVDKKGKYLVNYYKNRIPKYSMSGLMKSAFHLSRGETDKVTIHPDSFKNKIVIIGVSAVGGRDLKNTPLSETTPGPEIHATIISNILQGNHLVQEHYIVTFIITGLIILLSIFLVVNIHSYAFQGGAIFLTLTSYVFFSIILMHYTNYLSQVVFTVISTLNATGIALGYMRATEGAERKKYSKILGNMVDPSIVKEALNDLESLKKGSEKNITAFFSDVASFSTISEKLTSTDLASLLNEYLSAMTVILKHHGGTLDKYIGDAIVGIFNAPVEIKNPALAATKASLEMLEVIEKLRQKWSSANAYCKEAQEMTFRIGLNSGLAKVGFMGTDELASYTMMGDTVNLAARLEAAAKDYGVSILISEVVNNEIEHEITTRKLDAVRVKGKLEPVLIYEVIAEKSKTTKQIDLFVDKYEEAFNSYENQKWDEAIQLFKEAQEIKNKKDKAVDLLLERCYFYKENPPAKGWDGVFTRTHK